MGGLMHLNIYVVCAHVCIVCVCVRVCVDYYKQKANVKIVKCAIYTHGSEASLPCGGWQVQCLSYHRRHWQPQQS